MTEFRLSQERIAEIRSAQRVLNDSIALFEKLEDCGEDCQAERDQLREHQQKLERLMVNFGPKVQ